MALPKKNRLYTQLSCSRVQLAHCGFVSSQRTLRDLQVKQPVRLRGPDLPEPRALGGCIALATFILVWYICVIRRVKGYVPP